MLKYPDLYLYVNINYQYTCWFFAFMYTNMQRSWKPFSLQCQSTPPWFFLTFIPKRLGIFGPNSTRLLHVPIYAGLPIFIQLPATLTKLCHIKWTTIICSKCPSSVKTHARWSHAKRPTSSQLEIIGWKFVISRR